MIKVVLFDVGGVLVRPSGPQIKLYRLAEKIKQHGIRVSILSNVIKPIGAVLKKMHFYRGFEPVVLSYEEKIRKPNPEIYRRTIKRIGVKPNEILFIDNLAENILAAQKEGLITIHAVGTRQVVADLKQALKKHNNIQF